MAVVLPVLLLAACGSETQAEKHYNAAVKILDSKGHIGEGELDAEIAKALAELDEAIRLDSQYTNAYFRRAQIHEIYQRIPEAMQDLDQVIRLDPQHSGAYYLRGTIYGLVLEDHERAIGDYTEAIRLNIEHDLVGAYKSRADSHFALGQYRLAIENLDEVIRRDVSFYRRFALKQRGQAYAGLGEYRRALDDYAQAILLDPEGPSEAHRLRGQAFMKLGELRSAIQELGLVIETAHRDDWIAEAYQERAIAYTRLGNDAEAQGNADRAVELGIDAASLEREIEDAKAKR